MPTTPSSDFRGFNPDKLSSEQRDAALQALADFLYEFDFEGYLQHMLFVSLAMNESEDLSMPNDAYCYIWPVCELYKRGRQAFRQGEQLQKRA